MDNPKVSIVIPTHNRSSILLQTLRSVLSQTFSDFECLIIDDHSTDENTRLIAKEFSLKDKRFKAYELPFVKSGANAVRNYGLGLSKGEFINFLDSDDIFSAQKIEMQLNEFDATPALDAVSCRHIAFRETPGDVSEQYKFAPPESWLDVLFFPSNAMGGLWGTPCPLWRKKSLLQIGGWSEQYIVWTDPELNLRALLAGLKIKRLEQILVFCRVESEESLSSTLLDKNYGEFINGLHKAWELLNDSGNTTYRRQCNISDRLYNSVKHIFDNKGFRFGLQEWIYLCKKFDLPIRRCFLGLVLLIFRESGFSRLMRITYYQFAAYRKSLPPALPDLSIVEFESK